MSTATRIIKNTGFLYIKMMITVFISLYTTRLVLNSLGASDFGIFNIVGGAIAMLGFLNAAMASATQRFMSFAEGAGNKDELKTIFNVSLILHIVIAFIVGVLLTVAGFVFFNGILNIPENRMQATYVVYGSLVVSTMFTIMNVPYDAVLNAHENMKYYAIVGILETLLKLIVAFICVYTICDKLIVFGILMACIPFITLSVMKVYCHKNYEECQIKPRKYWNVGCVKEMLSFAGWNLMASMVVMVSAYGQGVILNSFFGPILNAAQGVAGQLNGQLQALSSNMMKAFNPVFAKSAGANDKEQLFKVTWAGAKFSTALYLMIAVPFFFYTDFILRLWLKNVPEWTVVFVRLQLIRSSIEFMFVPLCKVINANGKIKWFSVFSSASNIMQLPVIYLLFKLHYPPYVMYIVGIVFGNIIVYMMALVLNRRYCGLSIRLYFVRAVFPILMSCAICLLPAFVLMNNLPESSTYSLFSMVMIFVLFLISFFVVGCNKEEKKFINVALGKLKFWGRGAR